VRNLAGRSKEAASEIKKLINTSVGTVERGSQLVNESGQKLAEIVASAKKVTDIIVEIAGASRQQAQGIEQISQAVNDMGRVMGENARHLSESVEVFTVEPVERGSLRRPALADTAAPPAGRPGTHRGQAA